MPNYDGLSVSEYESSDLSMLIDLIERNLGYEKVYSFYKDFSFLFQTPRKLWVLKDKNQNLIGHIGVKSLSIKGFHFKAMGAVVIDKQYQGLGLSHLLINSVIENESSKDLIGFMLWSEKEAFYEKFGFFPAFHVNEYWVSYDTHAFKRATTLTDAEIDELQVLYESTYEFLPKRDKCDWLNLIQSSIELYIKKDDQGIIESYFCLNKGMDLRGVIHENGGHFLFQAESSNDALKMWTTRSSGFMGFAPQKSYPGFLFRPHMQNSQLLMKFFKSYLSKLERVKIRDLKSQIIDLDFDHQSYQLSMSEFIQGFMGPYFFDEVQESEKDSLDLYIPGFYSV